MSNIRIYVDDSEATSLVVRKLSNIYKEKATVESALNLIVAANWNYEAEYEFDILFLSGKEILDRGKGYLTKFKSQKGNTNVKVVAMSMVPEILEKLKDLEYPVDYFIDKRCVTYDYAATEEVKKTLHSYLL